MSKKLYSYAKCSTCRKAIKWLEAEGIEVETIPIVDAPPTREEIEAYWRASELPLKKFFNTSGQSYRNGGFSQKIKDMSDSEQLDALAADGKLMKRPILVTEAGVLVGFREENYRAHFGK